jgi:hypothetical protein
MDAHTGNIRSSIFSSSTCDTVQSLHGWLIGTAAAAPFSPVDVGTMAALSKNLDGQEVNVVRRKIISNAIS